MEILEEILKRLQEINNYISNLYKDYNFSPYSGSNLEAHINNIDKQYESKKSEFASYKPFYSRSNFLFKAIESTDNIILEMYAFLSGKYDKLKCLDCCWKNRLEGIKILYSKLKKKNVMGKEFYNKELQEIVEILEKSHVTQKYKRTVKRLVKKISRNIKRKKNGPEKHSNSKKA